MVWLIGGSLVFGAVRSGYTTSHAISELGQQGSTNAVAWNLVGFGGSALLFALYSTAILAVFGGGWLFRLTVVQAVAIAAGGVFSCDPGCPAVMHTPQGWLHTVSGLTFFATTVIVPLIAWTTFRRQPNWRPLARFSLAMGIALIALFVAGPTLFGQEQIGQWQRLTLAVTFVWAVVVGYRLFVTLRAAGVGRTALETDPGYL